MLKESAVASIGQRSLLVPAWIKAALAANDRLKLAEGDPITLDGNAGCIYAGKVRTVREKEVQLIHRMEALRAAKAPA